MKEQIVIEYHINQVGLDDITVSYDSYGVSIIAHDGIELSTSVAAKRFINTVRFVIQEAGLSDD